jgi:hypothetical protein
MDNPQGAKSAEGSVKVMMEKMPPVEKIYEAYSAIADSRVVMMGDSAAVTSSDHAKEYTVKWDGGVYSSNDNASYWGGYAGYPIIAVLMLQGKLKLDLFVAGLLKDINWKKLNEKHKSKYGLAVQEVLDDLKAKGNDTDTIIKRVEEVYKELESLDISLKRSSVKKNQSKGRNFNA